MLILFTFVQVRRKRKRPGFPASTITVPTVQNMRTLFLNSNVQNSQVGCPLTSRLAREFGPKGSELYAREELRAEIASWMISAELGLPHDPSQHLSYVDSWVKVLKEDPFEIVRACKDADQIKEFTLSQEKQRTQEQIKEQGMKLSGPDKAKLEQRESKYGVPENGKTWLKVPFSEKDQAKQLGAKWDKSKKMWFAPEGTDPQMFAAWLPENKAVIH